MSEPGVGVTRGPPTDDGMIEKLADEAERGFEPGQLQGRRRGPGRPPLGEARRGDDPELDSNAYTEWATRTAGQVWSDLD